MNSPANSKKRCIVILADGARKDVFELLLKRGTLKNISRHIVEPGSFLTASSVFPSTTGPAYTPYLMGTFPGRCGLPGIRWLDQNLWDKPFTFKRIRSYVSYEAAFLNRDLTGGSTLFEKVPSSVSIFNELNRGLQPGRNLTAASSAFWKLKSHFLQNGRSIDRVAADKLLGCFDGGEKDFPVFCFAVLMQIDSLSHKFHPFHQKVIDAYAELDDIVGEIVAKLKAKNVFNGTLLAIVSDHGLTATHTHVDLEKILEKKGFKTLQYPNIFRNFFSADCSVMVSGNSMAHIYFRNTDADTINRIALCLAERKETDIVLSRGSDGWISIMSERGQGRVKTEKDSIFYETHGGDPFGFTDMKDEMTKDEQLEITFETRYPDALLQACQIFDSPRSGNIIVSAKPGFDLRARFEFPEHRSSHGSMETSHISVPVALNVKTQNRPARTADIYPTVLRHLGLDIPEGIDGKALLADSAGSGFRDGS